MTTIKKIFNKLHKAEKLELANEKIELSIARNLQQALDDIQDVLIQIDMLSFEAIKEEYMIAQNRYEEAEEEALTQIRNGEAIQKEANDVLNSVEKMADELGIKPDEVTNYRQTVNSLDTLITEINNLDGEL